MDEDDEVLCRYGTPLEPLVEDEVPSKKPIQIEDQIVTDENGRRRFHGAFTGGFSAGFWNTVGSLEGWKPKEFKSSRTEKAERHQQKPVDFMDDEDMGEFGIAPQRVQTTEDFTPQDGPNANRKRKLQQKSDGPIPGMPVLQQLLRPAKDMVAIRLLKKMGWKQGQGIGARQTIREKRTTAKRNAREQYIMNKYGCDMTVGQNVQSEIKDDSDSSELSDAEEITFAPDDFEPYVCAIKDNTFGIGYSGLCRDPILKSQHVNLFGPLEILSKGNKKLSIRGQAFGVGALEEEDEDIYQRDDMTKYDFTLNKNNKDKNINKQIKIQESFVIEGFHVSTDNSKSIKKIFTIKMPNGFEPRNWSYRKTRFQPLDENRAEEIKKLNEYKTKGLGRHDLNPSERGEILGETSASNKESVEVEKLNERSRKKKSYLEKVDEKYKQQIAKRDNILNMITSKFDKFTKTEVINQDGSIKRDVIAARDDLDKSIQKENEKLQKEADKITNKLDTISGIFKPFASNIEKQERYEQFLNENIKDDNNDEIKMFLSKIQPIEMSNWDREMEKQEFLQAKKIYKPLKGAMNERFVTESKVNAEREIIKNSKDSNELFTTLRTKNMWKPCSLLCKKFNIAEPFGGTMIEEKIEKKPKFSVFSYLETSINNKSNFITPVIIPKHIEKPKPIISQRISSKDLFASELKDNDNVQTKEITILNKISDDNVKKMIKSKKESPKTDLEKKIEETKDKHPSEKKDLFKSIFDSSSEDENDEETNKKLEDDQNLTKTKEVPKNIIDILTKPAEEMNILRNNLPHGGIFAAYFNNLNEKKNEPDTKPKEVQTTTVTTTTSINSVVSNKNLLNEVNTQPTQKIIFKSKKDRIVDEEINEIEFYGPKVPTTIKEFPQLSEIKLTVDDNLKEMDDKKLLKLLKKNKKKRNTFEEWVEKSEENIGKETTSSAKSKKKKKKERNKDKDKDKDKDKEKSKKNKSKKHKKNKKNKK